MSATATRPRTQLALLTDGQLLCRYVARGDQEAFALIVQRHGPMVLGVCRRILRHDQDTEDAFQAAFVVLARKARGICKQDSVSSWLYKVAYRIALRSRTNRSRRHEQEQLTPPQAAVDQFGDVVRRELQQVLGEEVRRLPEKYRAPILLCYLQGQTNEEAAALLHCPTGTLKIRLLRGREMLRRRLIKRGLALSLTAYLGEALLDMAHAAVPQPLMRAAVQAATQTATPAVAALADGTLKSMCLAKLKVAALVLVTLALMCLADGMLGRVAAAPDARIEQFDSPIQPATGLSPSIFAAGYEPRVVQDKPSDLRAKPQATSLNDSK